MKIIKFKECNIIYAEDQFEYVPLHAHKAKDSRVTSCWGLSFFERLKILFTGKIYIQMLTFNAPLQPLKVIVSNPLQDVLSDDTN